MFDDNRILALNIGAGSLSLAEFSTEKSGGPVMLAYGIGKIALDIDNETDASAYIVSAIQEVMQEHGMRPAPLYMTVSGQAVFPRYVKLPPVAKDKIVQIIRYEAEQNVPFPIDEVVWDYQLLSETDSEDLSAMLVAVKTENVTRLTDCVAAAGLEPEIVDVAPMALYNTLRYNYPNLDKCTMILDIGARSSNLIFSEGSRIFSRSIPVAGNTITGEIMKEFEIPFAEAEELKLAHAFVSFGGVYAGPENETADLVSKIVRNVITRLHAEVNRSINFYRSQQGGQSPSLILLTGGSSIIPHLDTFFREKLKVEVDYLNPFASVTVGESVDTARVEQDLHRLGEVTGLALRRALTCPVEINLIPPALIKRKDFRRRIPFFALAGVAAILTMLCWWIYFYRMGGMRKNTLERAEERIRELVVTRKDMEAAARKRSEAEDNMRLLLDVVRLRTRWVEIVGELHKSTPEGVWIASLRPEFDPRRTRIVALEVSGRGFEDQLRKLGAEEGSPPLAVFRDRLRASPRFTNETELLKTMPVPRDAQQVFTMRIVLSEPVPVD